jgi:hypothetical protein
MPLQKLSLRPGINREGTSLANEGGYFESDKIRFRSGYPEKIGGWTKDQGTADTSTFVGELAPPTGSFWGVCRSLWNWINLLGYNLLGLGTNLKFYIQNGPGGYFYDVTPIRSTTAPGGVTFAASSGSPLLLVTDTSHGAQNGDFVYFSGAVSLGGAVTALILNREYQITYVSDSQYTVTLPVNATGGDVGNGGAATVAQYQITTGGGTYTAGVGWGAGGWGGSSGPSSTSTLTGSALTALPLTTLSTALNASATTISVATTAAFSATGSLLIDSEIINYTGKTATTFTGCTRGYLSTATTHVVATGVTVWTGASGLGITVASTAGFNAMGGYITIGREIISYVAIAGNTFTDCVRAVNGFSNAATIGTPVYQYMGSVSGWGSPSTTGVSQGIQLRTWSQSNFGEDLIINPRGGAIYYWANSPTAVFNRAQLLGPLSTVTLKGGSFTADSSCPSVANFITVSDASRFVIAFGTNDLPAAKDLVAPTTQDPLLIRWSDQEDPFVWWPEATNQAGSYRLSHGSTIVTYQQTRQEILVWTDTSLYSMQFLGAPYVWGFQIMGDNISIISPNAAAVANNMTFWMGTDKFYMYSGRVDTLPCTLRQYVYDDINLDQGYQCFATTNEAYNEVWFFYCSANSSEIDKYVVYNHLENVWYYGTMARTAWLDTPLRDTPIATAISTPTFIGSISSTTLTVTQVTAGSIVSGMTLVGEGIPGNTTITAFGTGTGGTGTYTISTPLTIASQTMTAITAQPCGILVNQESGNDDGTTNPPTPIYSYVQSSDFDIGDGHNFGFVWRIIPDLTFDGSTINNPTVDLTVRPRQFPGSPYGASADPTVTSTQNYQNQRTYTVQEFTEEVFIRIRGRQMAFKLESTELGVSWQLGVPRIDLRPDGRR